jgi:hypothetical protein
MNDFTAGAGEAYAACKTLFEDLNRLAIDFCHAVRNTGVDLPKSEEYSYSPNELFVKRDHVWMSYRLDESGLTFTAAYVILEKGTNHIKVGPPGRPEIWFLLGRATKPKNNIAAAVRSMFMEVERPNFRPALAVGGGVAHYSYDVAGEVWSVVLLGLELGEIDSPEGLERRVVGPLRAAATDHAIQL